MEAIKTVIDRHIARWTCAFRQQRVCGFMTSKIKQQQHARECRWKLLQHVYLLMPRCALIMCTTYCPFPAHSPSPGHSIHARAHGDTKASSLLWHIRNLYMYLYIFAFTRAHIENCMRHAYRYTFWCAFVTLMHWRTASPSAQKRIIETVLLVHT